MSFLSAEFLSVKVFFLFFSPAKSLKPVFALPSFLVVFLHSIYLEIFSGMLKVALVFNSMQGTYSQ